MKVSPGSIFLYTGCIMMFIFVTVAHWMGPLLDSNVSVFIFNDYVIATIMCLFGGMWQDIQWCPFLGFSDSFINASFLNFSSISVEYSGWHQCPISQFPNPLSMHCGVVFSVTLDPATTQSVCQSKPQFTFTRVIVPSHHHPNLWGFQLASTRAYLCTSFFPGTVN